MHPVNGDVFVTAFDLLPINERVMMKP